MSVDSVKELQTFEIGNIVWAKLNGFPHWPAIVCEPLDNMSIPCDEKVYHCVYFLGSRNFGLIPLHNLHDYISYKDKFSKGKAPKFKMAVKEMDEIIAAGVDPISKLPYNYYVTGKSQKRKSNFGDVGMPPRKIFAVDNASESRNGHITSYGFANSEVIQERNSSGLLVSNKIKPVNVARKSLSNKTFIVKSSSNHKKIYRSKNASGIKLGFVGLNERAGSIIRNLSNAGYNILVWNSDVTAYFPDKKNSITSYSSITNCVRDADLMMFCIDEDDQASEFFKTKEFFEALCYHRIDVINFGHMSRTMCSLLSQKLKFYNCNYLEVRLIGPEDDVLKGSFIGYTAGDPHLLKKAECYLKALTAKYLYLGKDIMPMLDLTNAHYAIQGCLSHHIINEILPLVTRCGISEKVWLLLNDNLKYSDGLGKCVPKSLYSCLKEIKNSNRTTSGKSIINNVLKEVELA